MKSTSDYIYLLVGVVVSWKNGKQSLAASSTIATEFIVCYVASNHRMWLQNFVMGLWIVNGIDKSLKLSCGNKSIMPYSNNNKSLTKSKYIDIMFIVVKERIQNLQLCIKYVSTNSMIADPLIKVLPPKMLHEHTIRMGVMLLENI